VKFKTIIERKIAKAYNDKGEDLYIYLMKKIEKYYNELFSKKIISISYKVPYSTSYHRLIIRVGWDISGASMSTPPDYNIHNFEGTIKLGGITTSTAGSKKNILAIIAHELQHLIQYEAEMQETSSQGIIAKSLADIDAKSVETGLFPDKAYIKIHNKLGIEHDSVLAGVLQIIKSKGSPNPNTLHLDDINYFSGLTHNTFIQKANSFGINNEQLAIFKKRITALLKPKQMPTYKKETQEDQFIFRMRVVGNIIKSLYLLDIFTGTNSHNERKSALGVYRKYLEDFKETNSRFIKPWVDYYNELRDVAIYGKG
jgi:hypothetical protein